MDGGVAHTVFKSSRTHLDSPRLTSAHPTAPIKAVAGTVRGRGARRRFVFPSNAKQKGSSKLRHFLRLPAGRNGVVSFLFNILHLHLARRSRSFLRYSHQTLYISAKSRRFVFHTTCALGAPDLELHSDVDQSPGYSLDIFSHFFKAFSLYPSSNVLDQIPAPGP